MVRVARLHTRLLVAATLAVALALALMAWGASTSTAGSAATKTIGVSVPTVQGPFFTAMLYGITAEAKKRGYKVSILDAGGYGNVDQQVTQMGNLIVKRVGAILVDPADPNVIAGSVKQAHSAKIPVIGSGDPAPGADANASSSHCDIGKAMAVGAKKLLPKGGTMAVLAGPPGATWSTLRLRCFKQAIAGSGITIKAEKTSEPAVDQGVTIASDFLQRFPKINLLYGADDTVGVGAAKAVQAAGRCGKTKVLFSVLGTQAEQLLRAGCVSYVVAQQTVKIGREAVIAADKLIKGQKLAKKNIAVPLVPVTRANVAKVDIRSIREPAGWKP